MSTQTPVTEAPASPVDMGSIVIPDISPSLEQLADLLERVGQQTPPDTPAFTLLMEARTLLQDIQAEAMIQVYDAGEAVP